MTRPFDPRSSAALAGLLVLLAGRAALAADTKTYLGSFCVPQQTLEEGRTAVIGGTIVAQSAFGAKVVCPIIKNVTNNSTLEEVTVRFSKSSAAEATCELSAFRSNVPSQTTANVLAYAKQTVTGSGTKTMTFSSFASGLPAPWAAEFTYYSMNCSLANGDRLQHYRVREAGTRTQEAKIYPPAMCRPDAATNTGRYYFVQGHIASGSPGGWLQASASDQNPGNSTFSMVCPAVGDISGNTAGTALAYITLMPPRNVGQSIACTLYSSNNNLPVDSHSATYPGFGTEFVSQTFDLDIDNGATWARYHIHCTSSDLGDAKIMGYRIEED
jgi:hypothetical protein